jgi:hypothetical protein
VSPFSCEPTLSRPSCSAGAGGATIDALADPVFPFLGAGFPPAALVTAPVLRETEAGWSVRYAPEAVASGLRCVSLDTRHAAALADFEALLAAPRLVDEFTLAPGDVWVLHNQCWLHGRRAIEATSGRLLKRCKVYAGTEGG